MQIPAWIREHVPLASYTTFGIGGPARWFAEPFTREEVVQTLRFAAAMDVPVATLGGGSNILVSDNGVDAVVVRLSPKGEFSRMEQDAHDPLTWRVGAAVPLQALVGETARQGVAGLESLAGIPGTVGGAVCMNCGSANNGIGQYVQYAEVCRDAGEFALVGHEALCFGYRSSALRGLVAVEFTLRLAGLEDANAVLARMREKRESKKAGQPLSVPSCGCIFKNPPGDSAGMLIDSAGCKGMREGGAEVSTIHANFIINQGQATCRDVRALATAMQEKVKAASGIDLEPEVILWGAPGEFRYCGGLPNVDNQ